MFTADGNHPPKLLVAIQAVMSASAGSEKTTCLLVLMFATVAILSSASIARGQTIYPIDWAEMLIGAQFDFKVEFPNVVDPARMTITLNGEDHVRVFGRAAIFVEREEGKEQSAVILRDASLGEAHLRRILRTYARTVDRSHDRLLQGLAGGLCGGPTVCATGSSPAPTTRDMPIGAA